MGDNFTILENWVKGTRPDLSKLGLLEAWEKAYYDLDNRRHRKINEFEPEEIRRTHNRALADAQDINPNAKDFMVDIRLKPKAIQQNIKSKINKEIHALGNFHSEIPLETIFNICKKYDVIPLQEDGTYWSGMLVGGAECGSKEAEEQFSSFSLSTKNEKNQYVPANNILRLTWCKMSSNRYEIVCYIS
jgi:hypothetical protein